MDFHALVIDRDGIKTLYEKLQEFLDQNIKEIIAAKKTFTENDILRIIEAEEKTLASFHEAFGAQPGLTLAELSRLLRHEEEFHEISTDETDPLLRKISLIDANPKYAAALDRYYLNKASTLANKQLSPEQKLQECRLLMRIFRDENIISPDQLKQVRTAGNEAGRDIAEEIKKRNHHLQPNDYEELFARTAEFVTVLEEKKSKGLDEKMLPESENESAQEAEQNKQEATNTSSDKRPSFFQPETPVESTFNMIKGASRVLAAVALGLLGGGVYLQKGWDGIDVIHQMIRGDKFSLEQINDWQRTLIGLPSGLASMMLYGISAYDFPELISNVLPAAFRDSKTSVGTIMFDIVKNYFASASMESITKSVLSSDSLLHSVHALFSVGFLSDDDMKKIMPYFVRAGGYAVNFTPMLRKFFPQMADPDKPRTEELFNRFLNINTRIEDPTILDRVKIADNQCSLFSHANQRPSAVSEPASESSNWIRRSMNWAFPTNQ